MVKAIASSPTRTSQRTRQSAAAARRSRPAEREAVTLFPSLPPDAAPAVVVNGRNRRKITPDTPLAVPFIVAVDCNEQIPYTFHNLKAGAAKLGRPLAIQTLRKNLETGDYSIVGYEDRIVVERKSLEDAYSSVAARINLEKEHARMATIKAAGGQAFVVVEASLKDALLHPPAWTRLSPISFDRTRLSWMQKYDVPWLFEDGRRRAEITTFRLLELWWRHEHERVKAEVEAQIQAEIEKVF